jgi:hypothetical protein
MSLKRTGTVVNGEIRNKGMSGNDIRDDIQEQTYAQRNPHKNYDDWERLGTNQNSIAGRWNSSKNINVGENRDLNTYKAENAKELLDWTGGSRRRRPSRKFKKSSKRVFRKKSRSTRRR